MKVVLNGEERDFAQPLTMQDLLTSLHLDPDTVAIECNSIIIPLEDHPNTIMAENDRIEIVQFIGGG